jgi:hypothetical protein
MILRAHPASAGILPAWLPGVERESEVAVRGRRQAGMPALPGFLPVLEIGCYSCASNVNLKPRFARVQIP